MENQVLIKDAAKCALMFLEDYQRKYRMTYPYKCLKALADLTIDELEKGKPIEECKYDPVQVGEKVGRVNCESESTMRSVKNDLADLMERMLSDINKLKDIARGHFSVIPTVEIDKSTGGNRNKYYIRYQSIDSENIAKISENYTSQKNQIKYCADYIKSPFLNWLYNHELVCFRLTVDIVILIFFLLLGAFSTYVMFVAKSSAFDLVKNVSIVIGGTIPFCMIFKTKWDSITKRIISITPPLATPIKFSETQLECVATDEIRKLTGKPIRKIQLVSYWATCPICKDKLQQNVRIDVSDGGKEFHNRLIGRCSESPTEHVFSFDRITRIGKPLRD